MNGQRYKKKEEESIVPPSDAVVHLIKNAKKKTRKWEKPIAIKKSLNHSNKIEKKKTILILRKLIQVKKN